jgi:hypothetical protein
VTKVMTALPAAARCLPMVNCVRRRSPLNASSQQYDQAPW